MLKTLKFKTHCKGDSHSSKTANIILPGLIIIKQMNALIRLQAKWYSNSFNCIILVETTHLSWSHPSSEWWHIGGPRFRGSSAPLHLHKCVVRIVSDGWISCFLFKSSLFKIRHLPWIFNSIQPIFFCTDRNFDCRISWNNILASGLFSLRPVATATFAVRHPLTVFRLFDH